MKKGLLLAFCFFLAASSEALCSVRVRPIPESLEKPRITVLLNGIPLPGASIKIERELQYPAHHKVLRSKLVTDNNGQVVLPKLPFGIYRIIASAKPNLTATLYLNFTPGEVGKDGLFSIELKASPSPEQVVDYEKLPVIKVTAFRGIIEDFTGAPVSKALIQIMDLDAQVKRFTKQFHSNERGRFASRLRDGEYAVSFGAPGFKSRILHILKSKDSGTNELNIKLQVGDATQ